MLDHEQDHPSRWAAFESVAGKIGCARRLSGKTGCTSQTLLEWIKKVAINAVKRPGVSDDMTEGLKALEREVRQLRQANDPYTTPMTSFSKGAGIDASLATSQLAQ